MSAAKEVSALETAGYADRGKSNLFRIPARSQRKFRSNPVPASSEVLQRRSREYKEIDVQILAQACDRANATAYKAVMKPKEGTILTVAKGHCRESGRAGRDDR